MVLISFKTVTSTVVQDSDGHEKTLTYSSLSIDGFMQLNQKSGEA